MIKHTRSVSLIDGHIEKNESSNKWYYSKFRQELDKMCIPLILNCVETRDIECDGNKVGILCTVDDYIDCVYVLPEYRRKGLAKKAVLDWLKDTKHKEVRLHIIHNNIGAIRFWTSIFDLTILESRELDAMYKAKAVVK